MFFFYYSPHTVPITFYFNNVYVIAGEIRFGKLIIIVHSTQSAEPLSPF